MVMALLLSFTLLSENPMLKKQNLLSFLQGLPESSGSRGDGSNDTLYYDWKTTSAFGPVRIDSAADSSTQDLCAGFPKHLLEDIQVVLKTGHGVLESRVHPQLHAGLSCIDNLLFFSDITETFDGRELVDVIADTPQHLIDATEQLEPYRQLRQCIANDDIADCGDAITPKDGWRIDKFKFLPSILRAWEMRPERKWYVFLEADTYMVWDTVFRLLEEFEADEPHYFGSPSPGREGTWFAYTHNEPDAPSQHNLRKSRRAPSVEVVGTSRTNVKPPERLPQLNYSLMKDVALRKKLSELGIPTTGPRSLLVRRHAEWINIVNANADSSRPKSKREMLRELDIWDRSTGRSIASSGNELNNAGSIMRKDFDGAAWSANHSSDFQDLISKARNTGRADSSPRKNGSPANVIVEQENHESTTSAQLIDGLPERPASSTIPNSDDT